MRQQSRVHQPNFLAWCEERKIQLIHIQPSRSMQSGRVESFNGRLRDECLNANWFQTIATAKEKIETWGEEYNTDWPQQLGISDAARVCGQRHFTVLMIFMTGARAVHRILR
jgi:hypothetical protein